MLNRLCLHAEVVTALSNFLHTYAIIDVLWRIYRDDVDEVWVVAGVEES